MTFHIGQKVVCVDDAGTVHVKEGFIYVVEQVFRYDSFDFLVLENVCVDKLGLDRGMFRCRFRPVQEKGMSILRSIVANPKRELETVE